MPKFVYKAPGAFELNGPGVSVAFSALSGVAFQTIVDGSHRLPGAVIDHQLQTIVDGSHRLPGAVIDHQLQTIVDGNTIEAYKTSNVIVNNSLNCGSRIVNELYKNINLLIKSSNINENHNYINHIIINKSYENINHENSPYDRGRCCSGAGACVRVRP